jgi:hypothetical protein
LTPNGFLLESVIVSRIPHNVEEPAKSDVSAISSCSRGISSISRLSRWQEGVTKLDQLLLKAMS